jgi:hypothetical protein
MALTTEPDLDIPLPNKTGSGHYYKVGPGLDDFSDRVAAAAKTAELLGRNGLPMPLDEGDLDPVATLVMSYAESPIETTKEATVKRVAALKPQQLLFADKLLKEWGHSVVESATQVRHLIMNKLLHETEHEDARIRLRALELLGKISDVGLFSERVEITHTHQTADDLRASLREKLNKLVIVQQDAPAELDDAEFDVDEVFGSDEGE